RPPESVVGKPRRIQPKVSPVYRWHRSILPKGWILVFAVAWRPYQQPPANGQCRELNHVTSIILSVRSADPLFIILGARLPCRTDLAFVLRMGRIDRLECLPNDEYRHPFGFCRHPQSFFLSWV